jgi:ABC-type spermidine/putrescine transport system permease subunit II
VKSNNETEFAAGFSWRRADRSAERGGWLRDLVISLVVALAASLLCIISDAHAAGQRTIQIGGANRTAHSEDFVNRLPLA